VEEKNKSLFTEEPMDADKLSTFWNMKIAKEIVDIFIENNVIMSDIERILSYTRDILEEKNNSGISALIGKEKLDVLARVFGASENVVAGLSARSIRVKDLFTKN
jgi:hypothetical protein